MGHAPTRWKAVVIVLALATMVGCQGLSTSKSSVQSTQNQLLGTLTAGPTSVSFGNVQVGTSQAQSDTLSNTGVTNLTISQAAVTGLGFSTTGLSLPLTLIPGQSTSFSVVFAPESAGSASGTLVLTDNGSSSAVSLALSGTAVAAGSLSATPTSFSFGNLQVGTNQTQTETLKNTGGDSLTISQATVSGAGFSYTGLSLPLTLAANQSATFGVVFAPTTAGASSGSVALTVSGSSTAVDIALSGTGVAPATLTATPASLTFTNITVGQNQAQTETVKNIGGENATISLATVTGTGFSISGISVPVTLTPGQSASFTVTFAPGSAGSFPGSVAIGSNASNPALSIGLTGSAVTPTPGTLAVSSVNVGSVVVGTSGTQTGTLSATGASVSVSSVSLSGADPSEFSISGLTFPVTVTTTQPVTFTVKFTPGATGVASASASFASTASNTPTAGSLTGTGTAAPVHSVSLGWTASTTTGVTSYNVYRAIYSGSACGSYTNIGSSPSSIPAYTDSVVADGTTYCYATTAVDPSGESAYSNIIQAVIPAP
jgi:Abnormal spindle-like microcephaly-assoc'd, ASPM-SPD-2-Hydin